MTGCAARVAVRHRRAVPVWPWRVGTTPTLRHGPCTEVSLGGTGPAHVIQRERCLGSPLLYS